MNMRPLTGFCTREYSRERMEETMENKDCPVLEWDVSKPICYDFHSVDSQYVMFNRGLEGCIAIPFSKPMDPAPGTVRMDGELLQCTVQPVCLGGIETGWLGFRPGGRLYEYGRKAAVQVSGFKDKVGNEMVPVTLQIESVPLQEPDPEYAEHEKIALQAAQDGIVLLKNENHTLPLEDGNVLNFFGKGIFEFRQDGFGAGKINPRYAVGLLEAARREVRFRVNEELTDFYACGMDRIPDEAMLRRAKEQSDTALFLLSRMSGENADNSTNRGEFYLTEEEEVLIGTLRERFSKVVVILNVGYPVSTAFAEKYQVDALLYSGFGGMLAGTAVMDVLTGRVNPSGRLPDTWSEDYNSIPASRNFYNSVGGKRRITSENGQEWLNTVYEEDLYVGYRYFETFPDADQKGYPFGYGLSYTTFSMVCRECSDTAEGLEAVIEVCNTGSASGREVVQVYLSKPQGELEQPAKELIAFEKTKLLAPGEKEQIVINVPVSRMVSYDEKRAAYVMVSGKYRVYLGINVRAAEEIYAFERSSLCVVKQVRNRMACNILLHCLRQRETAEKFLQGEGQSGIREGETALYPAREPLEHFVHTRLPETDRRITFAQVLENEDLLPEFVGNMDISTLARISVCARDGWGMEGTGEAGRLYRPEGLGLPKFIVADGNSGVNLRTPNIGLPSGATLCASFDKGLMEQVGRIIGEEAKELGVHLILAPAFNLHRNPLNGRNPEYFSEDPYLAGAMAGWYCKGLESTGTGGCYKHLMANNAESARKRNQSILSERAVRELYFRAFEYALEEHEPVSVMTAYNAVNGVFTSCDPELIQGLLFEECGFKGFVMADWASYDSADVAEMAMAGNTWITPGSEDDTYTKQIEAAVTDGRLPLAQLQDNVLRMVRVLVQLNR